MKRWGHPGGDKVILLLGDAALIALAAVAGWYLPAGQMSGGSHKALSLVVLLPTFLGAMYVCNLYNLAGINGLGMFVKVLVAVGTASAFCDGFFHVFRWKNATYYWSLGLCMVVAPVATHAWRRVYFHSARRLRTPEKLVVVGSARDAEILNAAIDQVRPRYSVVGMLCVEAERPASAPLRPIAAAGVGVAASASYGAGTAVAMAREAATMTSVMEGTAPAAAEESVTDLGAASSENLLEVVATRDAKVVVVRSDAMTLELAGVLTRLRFSGIQVYSLLDFCM